MGGAIISIDPGISGAFAIFATDTGSLELVGDLPVIRDQSTGWIDASHFTSVLFNHLNGRRSTAIIERVHAMPKNGSKAAFSQGLTFGSILATLQVAGSRIEMVAPQTWKADVGLRSQNTLSDRERKERARSKARLLYPEAELHLVKHHNRAEAVLIGHWYLNRNSQRAAA